MPPATEKYAKWYLSCLSLPFYPLLCTPCWLTVPTSRVPASPLMLIYMARRFLCSVSVPPPTLCPIPFEVKWSRRRTKQANRKFWMGCFRGGEELVRNGRRTFLSPHVACQLRVANTLCRIVATECQFSFHKFTFVYAFPLCTYIFIYLFPHFAHKLKSSRMTCTISHIHFSFCRFAVSPFAFCCNCSCCCCCCHFTLLLAFFPVRKIKIKRKANFSLFA